MKEVTWQNKLPYYRGDGIGPEIIGQAVKVLDKLIEQGLDVTHEYGLLGVAQRKDAHGSPYPETAKPCATKAWCGIARRAVGGLHDNLERSSVPRAWITGDL